MTDVQRDILHCIGNTSLVALRNIVPTNASRILLKIESENPTGSMKDRMALAMIEAAEAAGHLTADGSVVEYTGGSTGVSLALICAVKGYPLHIVTSDAFAQEKLDHMQMLGATLEIVRSESGRMTEKLTRDMIEAARVVAKRPGTFWSDQLNNTDQMAAYHAMADEIWSQTNGRIDGFVQSVGTAASLRGIAEGLRRHSGQLLPVSQHRIAADYAVHSSDRLYQRHQRRQAVRIYAATVRYRRCLAQRHRRVRCRHEARDALRRLRQVRTQRRHRTLRLPGRHEA